MQVIGAITGPLSRAPTTEGVFAHRVVQPQTNPLSGQTVSK